MHERCNPLDRGVRAPMMVVRPLDRGYRIPVTSSDGHSLALVKRAAWGRIIAETVIRIERKWRRARPVTALVVIVGTHTDRKSIVRFRPERQTARPIVLIVGAVVHEGVVAHTLERSTQRRRSPIGIERALDAQAVVVAILSEHFAANK